MPGLQVIKHYNPRWLRHDIVAGLVLATLLVPVGIAYAVAAGLPGIYGLYATIIPLFAYALFGPSRILVVAPDSALAAVILAVIMPLSAADPDRAIALAGAMAIVAGLTCLLAGWGKLGFVTELLSKPIRYGYMNGIALTVLISQLPGLFGVPATGDSLLERLWNSVVAIARGDAHGLSLGIGLGTLAVILLLRRHRYLPGTLIAVVLATTAVGLLQLEASGVTVLGGMPGGLPWPTLPWITLGDLVPIVLGGMAAAILAFAETSILSRSYAARLKEHVDPNQEMIGLGMANLATGLFQGFPVSSSASRTPVAEAAGAKTQLACIVGALAVTALLVFAPNLLYHLPYSALAAVVIAAAISLFEISDLKRIYRIQRWEFWLSITCCAGVLVLGPIPGIGLAIVIAIIEFLWDGWRPHYAVLGRVNGLKGYHDITRYPQARQVPGLVLFRWDAPLFFANAEWFSRLAMQAIEQAPDPARRLVVAAEPVTSIDVTAADMLAELDDALQQRGIDLCFAEMKDPVQDKLKRFGLYDRFGTDRLYPTVGQAVSHYVRDYAPDWIDWEDERLP
ncbi:MAG: SulP family inorganic anion transporter [Burkholderiaceae bacterium]